MSVGIILALSIVATNAYELFRLPDGCPTNVPAECMFDGSPTGKVLRIIPGSVSALYAAFSGQWERERLTGVSDPEWIYGDDPDYPGEARLIVKPLSFWVERGDLSRTDPRLSLTFGNYDNPSNRNVTTRRLVGWSDLPDAISSLRNSLTADKTLSYGPSMFYSSMLPLKKYYSKRWSTNACEILGVKNIEEMADLCWPQFATLSDDFFVAQTNLTNLEWFALPALESVLEDLDFYEQFGIVRDTYPRSKSTFLSAVTNFIPDDCIHQITNDSKRLLYWRQAAYNAAVAAIDVSHETGRLPKAPDYSAVDWIWDYEKTTISISSRSVGKAKFSHRKGLSLEIEDSHKDETNVTISTDWIYGDLESEGNFRKQAYNGEVEISGEVVLRPQSLSFLLTEGHTNTVYSSLEDDNPTGIHDYYIIHTVYDENEHTTVGSVRNEIPHDYEGMFSFEYESLIDATIYHSPTNVDYDFYTTESFGINSGMIEKSDIAFTEFIGVKTNNNDNAAEKNVATWESCIGISQTGIEGTNALSTTMIEDYTDIQSDLEDKAKDLFDRFSHDQSKINRAIIPDITTNFVFSPTPAPIGSTKVRMVDGHVETLIGERWLTLDEILVGGVYYGQSIRDDKNIFPSFRIDGKARGILTHYWSFPNMKIER